ncbi:MAG: thioredoxin family protein [Nitrososphaerales archaeon]|nr:thioredoxin family protein [Nitrososphaerales archaeon]
MRHRIKIFSGGCTLCQAAVDTVELGKCKDCKAKVIDVGDRRNSRLVKKFGITAVPSIVIDERIKVVGLPNFPWFCGDGFYKMLEEKYPLKTS